MTTGRINQVAFDFGATASVRSHLREPSSVRDGTELFHFRCAVSFSPAVRHSRPFLGFAFC